MQRGDSLAGERSGTSRELDAVQARLQQIVCTLAGRESGHADIKHYLSDVVDWENDLHAARVQRAAGQSNTPAPRAAVTAEAIEHYLHAKFPQWGKPAVSQLQTLAGGFSKTTVLFDVNDALNGTQSLVMRAERPMVLVFFDGAKVANEFKILDRLVQIHRTPIDPQSPEVQQSHLRNWVRYRSLTELAHANVAYWRDEIAKLNLPPSLLLVRALEWLAGNVPECDDTPSLIHRDCGLHNILVANDRVSCVLDWENASMGDPAEDLSWLANGLRGRISREHILNLYAESSGRPAPRRIRYYDVFTALKYAVTCLNALMLLERHSQVSSGACQLGFLYMHHGTASLNEYIQLAEQDRSD